ncbi:MAG: hypothetical protein QM793_01625 [Muricomes sp.]
MKMKWKCLILAMALLIVSPLTVYAEDYKGGDNWRVQFDGKGMESTFKSSDIDDSIYKLEPGDTVDIHIALDNKYGKDTDWYMSNKVLQSLEDTQSVADGGAYTYVLTYINAKGEPTVLFDSESVGGEGNKGGVGLHQATNSLSDYFYLDRIAGQGKGEITLLVGLEGETQGNAYQDTLAKLQMNFAVEPVTDPSTPKTPTSTPGSNAVKPVKTGDNVSNMIFVLLTLVAGMTCVIVVILRMRKQQGKQDSDAQTRRRE